MQTRHLVDPVRYRQLTGPELRQAFLVEDLFAPDEVRLLHWEGERTIIGSAVPATRALALPSPPEIKAESFAARREIGIVNLGGPGTVSVDGASHALGHRDMLYVGRGAQEVSFASTQAQAPACFYLVSHLAHAPHPTTSAPESGAQTIPIGDTAHASERVLRRYIHEKGVRSCQLVMGVTDIKAGSVWNTLPPHTHDAAHRDLPVLRPGRGRAGRAPHGPAGRHAAPGGREPAGRALAPLVDPLRRRQQPLRVRVEHGRREPGVRGHAGCPARPPEVKARALAAAGGAALCLAPWLVGDDARAPADPWRRLPQILARIRPPTFPARDFRLADFGGRGDGATDNTAALRSAIEACHQAGGGRVVVPAGEYLTGPVHLKSRVNLHLAGGCDVALPDGSRALPARGVHPLGGRRAHELLAAGLRVRAARHRDHRPGHARRPGRRGALVALEEDPRSRRGPALLQMAEDGVPVEQRVFRAGATCGRASSRPTAAATC